MIGFEYICKLFNVQYKHVAEELGITKQTVNSWTSGRRKIPKKYLPILSKKFNISEKYFQKELNEIDKMEIQNIKLKSELKNSEYEYEDTITDPDTGEEITVTRTDIDAGALFDFSLNSYNLNQKKLLIAIRESMDKSFKENDEYMDYGLGDANEILKLYKQFLELVKNPNVYNSTLKKVLLGVKVSYGKAFSSDKLVRKIAKAIKEYDKENKKW